MPKKLSYPSHLQVTDVPWLHPHLETQEQSPVCLASIASSLYNTVALHTGTSLNCTSCQAMGQGTAVPCRVESSAG